MMKRSEFRAQRSGDMRLNILSRNLGDFRNTEPHSNPPSLFYPQDLFILTSHL